MNIQDLKESLKYMFKAELTPFIWGRRGIGKTESIKQVANELGYKFFGLYLGTQSDVGDILGLAEFVRDKAGNPVSTKFAMPEWLKGLIDYCEANPESGGILFLDEFNRGRRDVLSGMFSLALDKTFHTIKLPKNLHVIAAGNPPTDEYTVTDIGDAALMARFVHVKLEPTFQEWVKYAENKEMDNNLVDFLKNQPELLETKHNDFQLPVSVDRRAYERLDRLFKLNTPAHLMENLMVGIIGLERTVAYQNYMKSAEKPLTAIEVLNGKGLKKVQKWCNPDNTLSSLLNLTSDNLKAYILTRKENFSDKEKENLFKYTNTIPKDVFYPLYKDLIQGCPDADPTAGIAQHPFREFFLTKKYEADIVDLMKIAKGQQKKDEEKAA